MLSLRPGELLLAGWVGPFMDDPYIVASEMGHCPLATLASRGSGPGYHMGDEMASFHYL